MTGDFIKILYPLFIVTKIKAFFSRRKQRKEIERKAINFEPITKEEFDMLNQPVFKDYEDYIKTANLPPKEKEEMLKTSESFLKIIKEMMKNDPKFKNKKHFFSD